MSIKIHCLAWTLGVAVTAAAGCTFEPEGPQEIRTPVDETPEASSQQTELTAPKTCTLEQMNNINGGAAVTCNGTMPSTAVMKAPLKFRGSKASNIVWDCNGAYVDGIYVYSNIEPFLVNGVPHTVSGYPMALKDSQGYYVRDRPENITIKNCHVMKDIRVWGLGKNGQDEYVWTSSRDTTPPGHVVRARHAAPTNIVFDNVTIHGVGPNAYYLGPGVTFTTLKNSEIEGRANINVYLDAESAFNTIKNNHIHADTESRELFAIDGSSYNTIVNNRFSALSNGGIYLYRNCGEDGAVRYSNPTNNQIINNVFYYKDYTGDDPSVWLGSRNGQRFNHYCGEDSNLRIPASSSTVEGETARYNVVMQNQIHVRSVSDMIRTGEKPGSSGYASSQSMNSPNYVKYNTTVSTAVTRKAGCYLGSGYAKDFINHGEKLEYRSGTRCTIISCNDNVRSEVACPPPPPPPPPPDTPAEGWLDSATEGYIAGWARDPDFNGPVHVHIYIDGALATGILASIYRSDVGERGYLWVPPKLTPGPHRVEVYAIGLDGAGRLTNRNPLLSGAPKYIYAKDFEKPGNNGTTSCHNFCEGAQWGEVGFCVGAWRTDTNERVTCSTVPGYLNGHGLACECARGFVKPGNNGTVSCNTFCAGGQWGPVGICVGALREDTQQRLGCDVVPGLLSASQLTCHCVP
jgi:hypothetical protein